MIKDNEKTDRKGDYYIMVQNERTKYTKLVPRNKGISMIVGVPKSPFLQGKLKDSYGVVE